MRDKYQVAYDAWRCVPGESPKRPLPLGDCNELFQKQLRAAIDASSLFDFQGIASVVIQPVSVTYEFNERSARQVVTDPATGRKWYTPLVSEEAWRDDKPTATLDLQQAPDVSALRWIHGERVEVVGTTQANPVKGDLIWEDGRILRVGLIGSNPFPCWILRAIPEPAHCKFPFVPGVDAVCEVCHRALESTESTPRICGGPKTSVYGCDPKDVDLSPLRGPNNLPVEWVDFREPLDGELCISTELKVIGWLDTKLSDRRRIIVRRCSRRRRDGASSMRFPPAASICLKLADSPTWTTRKYCMLWGEAWKEGHSTFRQTLANVVRAKDKQ